METIKYTSHLGYLGDFATEWWTDEDWKEYYKHIEKLKESGDYGKEVSYCIDFIYNPLLDRDIDFSNKPKETMSFIIFDINN